MTEDHSAFGPDRFGQGAEKGRALLRDARLHPRPVDRRREAALERNTAELRKALDANTALTREIRDRLA